jgi:uncharacterized protein with HEPN domain
MSKRSRRDYRLYVDDVIRVIEKIEKYSQGLSFNKLSRNSQAVDGIVRIKVNKVQPHEL